MLAIVSHCGTPTEHWHRRHPASRWHPNPSQTEIDFCSSSTSCYRLHCGHTDCVAFFSDLDDSTSHVDIADTGVMVVNTCDILEVTDETGKTKLVKVSDKLGECAP